MINKVVYSYWSKPANDKNVGFNSEQAFGNCAKLSVLQSKKWANKVELITDKKGKKLLIDKLNLPFDNILVCLDDLNHINKKHWAIGKLYACSLQKEPFMHLDFDAIWFKKPPRKILEAEACFQNWEKNTNIHQYYKKLINICKNTPELKMHKFSNFNKIDALCCGFIGFNKLDKIELWYELALDYINKAGHKTSESLIPSIMFEQYYISNLLKYFKINIETLGDEWVEEKLAKQVGYTHLIAESKRNKNIEQKILNRVKKL